MFRASRASKINPADKRDGMMEASKVTRGLQIEVESEKGNGKEVRL